MGILISKSLVVLLLTLETDDLGYHGVCSYIFAYIVQVDKYLFKLINKNDRWRSIDVVVISYFMTLNRYFAHKNGISYYFTGTA